jgi:Fe-S-cluster containining protein
MEGSASFLNQLTDLFKEMDAAYEAAAGGYGFVCRGCRENCCKTLFHHHTLLEYLYLRQGLAALPQQQQSSILQKAAEVRRQAADQTSAGQPLRIMCPVNHQQRCQLYAHRPMICRLHGLPHQLRRPDGKLQTGPGCADFEETCGNPQSGFLDRTPYYHALAQLERRIRQQTGFTQKVKLTVADILVVSL